MKKNIVFYFLLFSLFSCTNENTSNNTNTSKNNSFVEEKENKTLVNNHYFKHFNYVLNEKNHNYIVEIKQNETILKNKEFTQSTMQISDYPNTKWTIKTQAHQIENINNVLQCQDLADFEHQNTYNLYNIESGKHLLAYTESVLKVYIPQSPFKRFIGVVARSNTQNLLKKYDNKTIALLSYASEEKGLQQFLIKTTADVGSNTPTLNLVSLDTENELLSPSNDALYFLNLDENYKNKDINFAFGLSFYIGETAEENTLFFEVREDKIELKNTTYDQNTFQLVAIK